MATVITITKADTKESIRGKIKDLVQTPDNKKALPQLILQVK